ncbi:MAG: hypothetical protein V4696_10425 [Pseudomonadota bacterium]
MLPGLGGFGQFGAVAAEAIGLGYMTEEALGEVSDTSASWLDTVTLSAAGADFTPSADYLGLWSIDAQSNNTTSVIKGRVTVGGVDIFTTDTSLLPNEVTAPVDYYSMGGLFRYQPGASPAAETFKIQVARGTNAATFKGRNARLSLLKLGGGDAYAQSVARQTFDDPANKTAQTAGTLSFTPPSSGNYVVIVSCLIDLVSLTSTDIGLELTDGTTSTGELFYKSYTVDDRVPAFMVLLLPSISGAKTITLKIRQGGSGTSLIGISEIRIVAIREDRFASVNKAQSSSASSGTDTAYTATSVTQTFTPSSADHLTVAAWAMNSDSTSISSYSEYSDGGTTLNEAIAELGSATGATPNSTGCFSHRIASYAAAGRTQVINRKSESGATTRVATKSTIVTFNLAGV